MRYVTLLCTVGVLAFVSATAAQTPADNSVAPMPPKHRHKAPSTPAPPHVQDFNGVPPGHVPPPQGETQQYRYNYGAPNDK